MTDEHGKIPLWVIQSGWKYVRAKFPPVSKPGEYHPIGWEGTNLIGAVVGEWHDIEPPSKPESEA